LRDRIRPLFLQEHTVPSPDLYPHQWSWDSAFAAIGLATYNQAKEKGVEMLDVGVSGGIIAVKTGYRPLCKNGS